MFLRGRSLRGVAGSLLLATLLWGCGKDTPATIDSGTAPAAGPKAAASPEWAREGDRLRQFKRDKNSENAGQRARPGNADDFAYQSQPIDIAKSGDYVLLVKVPSSFDFPRSPSSVVVNYPDDSPDHFVASTSGPITVVGEGPGRAVQVPIRVTDVRASYPGYSIWIY